MSEKIALVTGANKGIGLEISRQLAAKGVHVIMSGRNVERLRKAADNVSTNSHQVEMINLDVLDLASIKTAVEQIQDKHGRLDILINNAGLVDPLNKDGPPTTADPGALSRCFETNVVGVLRVSQAMLPLLYRSEGARIINLTTTLGSLSHMSDPNSPWFSARLIGYGASKAAMNMITVQLAQELKETPHTVNSVSPGWVKTDLTGGNGFLTPEEGAKTPVKYALLGKEDAVNGQYLWAEGNISW